jgi:hypothetical protein
VRIFDYVDRDVPVLLRMIKRRFRAYRTIGYAHGKTPFGYLQPRDEPTIEWDKDVGRHFDESGWGSF